jgi:hypothetical protein
MVPCQVYPSYSSSDYNSEPSGSAVVMRSQPDDFRPPNHRPDSWRDCEQFSPIHRGADGAQLGLVLIKGRDIERASARTD